MSRRKSTHLYSCPVLRRIYRRHLTLNLETGAERELGAEWVKEPCNAPLFSNDQGARMCRSCARQWQHPQNYFACAECDEPRERDNVTCLRSECQEAHHKRTAAPKRRGKGAA